MLISGFVPSWSNQTSSPDSPPPGPIQLPLIGSAHWFLFGGFRNAFTSLKRNYGPIFSYKLLFYDCVGVSDFGIVKEILNSPGD